MGKKTANIVPSHGKQKGGGAQNDNSYRQSGVSQLGLVTGPCLACRWRGSGQKGH